MAIHLWDAFQCSRLKYSNISVVSVMLHLTCMCFRVKVHIHPVLLVHSVYYYLTVDNLPTKTKII